MIFVMKLSQYLSRSRLILAATILFILAAVYVQFQKPFGWDELEHIHSSYMVYSGYVPYQDFFQHHHPLMWYVYAPVFAIFTDKIAALWAIKIISVLVGLANIYLLYRISSFYLKTISFRLIAVILSITSIIFVFNGMEIRPDNLMFSGILGSYYFLLRYFEANDHKNLIASGVLLGISMIFLQKAIIFIAIFNAVLLIEKAIEKAYKHAFISLAYLNGALLLPLVLFAAIILSLGLWQEYYFYNWTLNSVFDDVFSIARTFKEFTLVNTGFFIVLTASLVYGAINYKEYFSNKHVRILLITGGLFTVSLVTVTRSPYSQYLLSVIFFGSILISHVLEVNYRRDSLLRTLAVLMVLAACSIPVFFYKSFKIKDYTFGKMLQEVQSVEAKSPEQKEGLRIQEDMNLFYTGHKFYWFSPEGQRTIKKLQREGKLPERIPQI
jgi:hypothetical protein